MLRPSPPSLATATPGSRCSDSARFASGNFAMSSALMTSTTPLCARFSSSALARLPRKPVTTTSSIAPDPEGASSMGCCASAAIDHDKAKVKRPIVDFMFHPEFETQPEGSLLPGPESASFIASCNVSRHGRGGKTRYSPTDSSLIQRDDTGVIVRVVLDRPAVKFG